MKGCIKGLIGLVVLVVLVVVAIVILLNVLTPATIGIADIEVYNGQTLRDMGLADVKFIEIYKLFKSIMNPDESSIVQNEYNPETEKAASTDNLSASSLEKDAEGNIDYTGLLSEPALYSAEMQITYRDTTLGYIFDQMIKQGIQKSEAEAEAEADTDAQAGVDFLKSINASISEVTITKNEDGTGIARIVLSVNISTLKTQIEEAIPAGLGSMLPIPDVVYLVSYLKIDVDANGYITYTSEDLRINDTDNAIATAIFNVLASEASTATDGEVTEEQATDVNVINEQIGNVFSSVIKNIGRVGTATVDANGVVTSNKVLGKNGIGANALTVITNTAENVGDGE